MLMKPPMKRVPADAPGCDATGSRSLMTLLAVFAPLFTAPSFRTFCGAGLRVPRPDREADGVRHAGRGGPVPALAARPGALVLLPRPVEPR